MSKTAPRLEKVQSLFFHALTNEPSGLANIISPIASLGVNESIDIYRRAYPARLTEALGETFEATWWILGDSDYFDLANRFINKNVSQSYDLSDYGEEFPTFLDSDKISDEIPFISDLARFEWTFKTIFHKPNISTEIAEWNPASTDPERMRFALSPSAMLFSSPYSVYEIWRLRDHDVKAVESVNWQKGEHLIVVKRDSQVFVRHVDPATFSLIDSFANGLTLEEAINELLKKTGSELTPETVQQSFSLISELGVISPVEERREQ